MPTTSAMRTKGWLCPRQLTLSGALSLLKPSVNSYLLFQYV